LATPFTTRLRAKLFAKLGTFLEKEFLAKWISGRKVELDEIIDPSVQIPSGATKDVPSFPPQREKEHMMIMVIKLRKLHAGLREPAALLSGLGILF
jgi:hypothetical protein